MNQFLRSAPAGAAGAPALSEGLEVEPGYELALAAALGPRLAAGVVGDVAAGERALDSVGDDGGLVLVAPGEAARSPADGPPVPGAERLLDRVRAEAQATEIAAALLADTWVVASLADVPAVFAGVAVTRSGRVWRPGVGELRQAAAGGGERMLEQRNRRAELVRASERRPVRRSTRARRSAPRANA